MLYEKMYVRCPADQENVMEPRVYICGQILQIDTFKKTVTVKIYDPFLYLRYFEDLPSGELEFPESEVDHCTFFINSAVLFRNENCKVLSCLKGNDGFYYYYLQNTSDKHIFKSCETDIIASFHNGRVDPAIQLKRYEFQNPCWYLGHSVVSRSMNILDNSIYGFRELAGSKIYLLPHQMNTIMRCLQESPCRYMLADEVGMGKTIEAISIYKIYMQNQSDRKALLVVPEILKEQWKAELFLKFSIEPGPDQNHNSVIIKSMSELDQYDVIQKWDFIIIDEVHRYLGNQQEYDKLHSISKRAENILLLSATPVQQRREEYLALLRLLLPMKYDGYSVEQFCDLIDKQSNIIQRTALILDDLGDYEEVITDLSENGNNPHDSEDCMELYDDIHDGLKEICDNLGDDRLSRLFDEIDFESSDLGVYAVKVIISYICSNYQIESNIIRNRRKLLESAENEEHLLPSRELQTITYQLDENKNVYESLTYLELTRWILEEAINGVQAVEEKIRPLLGAFFSSPWAFLEEIEHQKSRGIFIKETMIENAMRWRSFEQYIVEHAADIIDDPDTYEERYSTRLISVLNCLYDELYDQKIVLFTNYSGTFEAFRKSMIHIFKPEEISFFGAGMNRKDMELNACRFQNDAKCRMMLCDSTGGEGRNFQCADYIVHIDLPWDANMIEQRIGRLDRLERDPARAIVHSVVVYAADTFEEALFKFWNDGLKIFTQSLSGMEIIMKDINHEIISAIQSDFRYGLFERIPGIIKRADDMRLNVRKEQNYDAAGFMYKPMYNELRRLIDYYAQNENKLFANTMTNWASLAGFHGFEDKTGVITYAANSFVPKSAINSQLIPPQWNDYLNAGQNVFIHSVQDEFDKSKSTRNQERSIRGTFIRKQAIENDYLHFFAPGDEIFDCIVDNAINSCKGRSCAFAMPAQINWSGLIFTWSITPSIEFLLENDISLYAISPYRHYLVSEQVVIPISIRNEDSVTENQIIQEYRNIVNAGFKTDRVVHLGKRSHSPGFLKGSLGGCRNINWFKNEYKQEDWNELVSSSRKEASERALSIFKRRSNIKGAREEMERALSARAANSEYYGLTDEGIEKLKRTQELILDAIKRPKLMLDSAAFIWMIKWDYE